MLPSKDQDLLEEVSSSATDSEGNLYANKPIKILVYPPKNKQFRFDEKTNKIEIEPIKKPSDVINEQTENKEISNSSGLTPLVENIHVDSNSDLNYQTTQTKFEDKEKQLGVTLILKIEKVFQASRLKEHCFLKGCKWSGDGLCLLSNSEDNVLRLFEISEDLIENPQTNIQPVLKMKEGGTIYDYVWYPKMNSLDLVSCVFACTSQGSPIHLWDAYTGHLRATYQPINQYDEVTSAYSLAFSPDGLKLYSGFKKCIRIFDISQPGRISEERSLKEKNNPVFQSNIISSITINPCMPSLYALGSYDKTIGIYCEPQGDLICVVKGHSGGITQVQFSSNGYYLFSGARKDHEILCWDVRNPGKIVFSMEREVNTQQKIQFDLSTDQEYLITGTTNCYINIFDINSPAISEGNVLKSTTSWKAHEDCVNGIHFHPKLSLFASSSGQRHLPGLSEDDDEEICANQSTIDNSIKIWRFSPN